MDRYKLSQAGVDVNEGVHRFNGKSEMYEKYLYRFPDDTHFQELCAALDAHDAEAAFQAAHALKGVAGNLSINKLFEAIKPLVELLRVHSLDGADKLLIPVKAAYEAAYTAVSESIQSNTAE